MTSSPAFFRAATAGGIRATRFSPGHVSRGTPTLTARSLADLLDPLRNRRGELRRQGAIAALRERLVDAVEAGHLRRGDLLARLRNLGEAVGLARGHRRVEIAVDDQQRLLHFRDDRRRIVGEQALEHRRVGLLADRIGNAFPSAPADYRGNDLLLWFDAALAARRRELHRVEQPLLLPQHEFLAARAGGAERPPPVDVVAAGGRDQDLTS